MKKLILTICLCIGFCIARGAAMQNSWQVHTAWAAGEKSADEYVRQGMDSYREGSYDKALASLTKAIATEPNNPAAYYSRSLVYEAMKMHDQAVADYNTAVALEAKGKDKAEEQGVKADNKKAVDSLEKMAEEVKRNKQPDQGLGWDTIFYKIMDWILDQFIMAVKKVFLR